MCGCTSVSALLWTVVLVALNPFTVLLIAFVVSGHDMFLVLSLGWLLLLFGIIVYHCCTCKDDNVSAMVRWYNWSTLLLIGVRECFLRYSGVSPYLQLLQQIFFMLTDRKPRFPPSIRGNPLLHVEELSLTPNLVNPPIRVRDLLANYDVIHPDVYDYSVSSVIQDDSRWSKKKKLGFDFVADTGDGYLPTLAIARALTRGIDGSGFIPTLVVFGGDMVYPHPTESAYDIRLRRPFVHASTEVIVDCFVVPGNHDYIDFLSSFRSVFISADHNPKKIGNFSFSQSNNFFVLRLPNDWYILGLDDQLTGDIDGVQLLFFVEYATTQLGVNPPVIRSRPVRARLPATLVLVIHQPFWLFGDHQPPPNIRKLLDHLDTIIDLHVAMIIAGDMHYYCRHTHTGPSGNSTQYVVSGGGGAFLHSTAFLRSFDCEGPWILTERGPYPSQATSMKLLFWNLAFAFLNWEFGLIPAFLLTFSSSQWITAADSPTLVQAWTQSIQPVVLIILILAFLIQRCGAAMDSDEKAQSKLYLVDANRSSLESIALQLLRLCCLLLIMYGSTWGFVSCWSGNVQASLTTALSFHLVPWLTPIFIHWASWLLLLSFNWLSFLLICGIYLTIASTSLAAHTNEASSSLRIADHKSFLRCEVDEMDGSMTVTVAVIPSVAFDRPVQVHESFKLLKPVLVCRLMPFQLNSDHRLGDYWFYFHHSGVATAGRGDRYPSAGSLQS